MVAMAQLEPEQHQVQQGWPWKSREQAEWAQRPSAPAGHGSCWLGAAVPCHRLPCWCHPHCTEDTRPLSRGCPRGRGPVWIPIRPPALAPGSLAAAVNFGRRSQTPAQERLGQPLPPRGAAATRVQGMREPPSPGHPEEKAVPLGDAGHVEPQGATSAVAAGAGSGQRRARLPAWPQGVRPWGAQGPRGRVLCAACVPALPHHLRWAPSLQHLPDHLQDCLPPEPWAGPLQASLRLLPRLEEGRWAPRSLWSSNLPATMPEWRELCPARPLPVPRRVAGGPLPDGRGRVQCWTGRLSPALCQHRG